MAVHVLLDREQIRSILSLYHLEALEDFGGITAGAINTSYWVRVAGKKYFLRITEKKRVEDLIYEKELLHHLRQHGLPVPRILKNVAKGTFTPWSSRGRFVSLFEYMPGRELGLFEIRSKHTRVIGEFMAEMHLAAMLFPRNRANGFALPVLGQKVDRLVRALDSRRLARRFAEDVELLAAELERQGRRHLAHLPRGTVHGDLFVENTKFRGDGLAAVLDFEMASNERFVWDLAVALNDWCWEPSSKQAGGPAGKFDSVRMRAMISGYTRVRVLSAEEKTALAEDLRLAAARFAITRMVDFDLVRMPPERRAYKDYRHYTARLKALRDGGAERLLQRAGC